MSSRIDFRFSGEFLRTAEYRRGLPRRIEVKRQGTPVLMKLARKIRAEFIEPAPGTRLTFSGRTRVKKSGPRLVVTDFSGPNRPRKNREEPATIQVCGKKNCWKNGGAELWTRIEQRIAELGLHHIRLEKCGCLGTCKQRPCTHCIGCPRISLD